MVQCERYGVQGTGYRVQGAGYGVQGTMYRVQDTYPVPCTLYLVHYTMSKEQSIE